MEDELRLGSLPILALDCQATGAAPARGHLLEVGWSRTSAACVEGARIESRLLELPPGVSIPERVRRLTGISKPETKDGVTKAALWQAIVAAAAGSRTAVIHFSGYELPYLRALHREASDEGPFPFRVLCTHKIAKRLLPTLPRHSLRALAGYFGHTVPELRRAAHHVAATVSLWSALVARLEQELDIDSLESLLEWIALPVPRSRRAGVPSYPMAQELRRNLPRKPGVYRMLRSNGDVLYVGKATSLRERVASYFRASASHPQHILEMLAQARDLETTVSDSALEAALHEADEIKRLSPPYNRALRARDRTLVYMDGELTRLSAEPDATFRLGPLPGGRLPEAFVSIGRLLRGEDVAIEKVLASEECYLPDESTFHAGFTLFRERLAASGLLARGATLWTMDPGEDEEEVEAELELELEMQYEKGAPRWRTAEGIAESMDYTLRQVSHLVRRAHWLSLLGDSTLAWEDRGGERRAILLEGGRVVARSRLPGSETIPEPPRSNCEFFRRRLRFDIERYDRLVVLTKEVRRLLREERWVMLSIGRGSTLGRVRLGRIFKWI